MNFGGGAFVLEAQNFFPRKFFVLERKWWIMGVYYTAVVMVTSDVNSDEFCSR